ncbi:WG repeat-containing protein [Gaetbulibacter aestuarii]|uniref:WG repeat-containing protein n=1 Tax=Gaetbulibacter aestuarii TaxID=1502358 RepID=A0ABW7MXR9_9FLAO
MKNLLLIWLIIPVFAFSQITEDLDFIAPFNDGLAAVQKGKSWGFIDQSGALVIPFRNDLVVSRTNGLLYPVFQNDRCLISTIKDGITYFGFIDTTGKTVIAPQFLNATNFENNAAIALNILKQDLGDNGILGKHVVGYRYFEVVIDPYGNIGTYLNPKGTNMALDKKYLKTPPVITSRQISDQIYAVRTENNKWKLVLVDQETAF